MLRAPPPVTPPPNPPTPHLPPHHLHLLLLPLLLLLLPPQPPSSLLWRRVGRAHRLRRRIHSLRGAGLPVGSRLPAHPEARSGGGGGCDPRILGIPGWSWGGACGRCGGRLR